MIVGSTDVGVDVIFGVRVSVGVIVCVGCGVAELVGKGVEKAVIFEVLPSEISTP